MKSRLGAALFFATTCACLAEEPKPAGSPPEGKWGALVATLENGERGAEFKVQGTIKDLPDGVMLHVTLSVAGNFPVPIEAAFFQVKVVDGKYESRKAWDKKTLPPLTYWARADLLMSKQHKTLRAELAQKYGWGYEHREQVGLHAVSVGTPEENLAFRKEALTRLREFVVKTRAIRDEAAAAIGKPKGEDWAEVEKGLYAKLKACRAELTAYLAPRVVWHESRLIEDVQSAHDRITLAVQDHGKGKSTAATEVSRVNDFLDAVLASIDGRLPTAEMPGGPIPGGK